MIFILVWFVAWGFASSGLAYFFTRRGVARKWPLEGPNRVGQRIKSRDRTNLFVTVGVVAIVAVFEALLADFSFWMRDLQADTFRESAIYVTVGDGSISWLLYLSVLVAVVAGLTMGSLAATRQYPELRSVGISDVRSIL